MTAGKHPKDTAPQMHKGRQLAAFDWRTLTRLTLRELLAPTRFVQTDFLPFNFTRIARNEASFRQRRLQCGIVFDQSAGNTVTHGACLTRLTTARHVNLDVKPRNLINKLQRLTNDHAPSHPRKELIDRLAWMFERRAIKMCPHPDLLRELEYFEAKPTASGATRLEATGGMHDDLVIALSLAVHGLDSGVYRSIQVGRQRQFRWEASNDNQNLCFHSLVEKNQTHPKNLLLS